MTFAPVLSTVVETIQTAIAPVFLLAGIGSILNVMTGRLARVVDRARRLEEGWPPASAQVRARHGEELRMLGRRMIVINRAVLLTVTSAMAICMVVALLFVAELFNFRLGREIAVIFIVAMALLTAGLLAFMVEVRLSVHATRIRADLLDME